MADVMTPAQRSRVMSRIRGKDTIPERYLNELLRAAGFSFTRHDSMLPGRPDFVFWGKKVAVFIDGDFWHGWRFPLWKHRLGVFWKEKIAKNRSRDQRNFRRLRRAGWKVVRIWEHQLEMDARRCIVRVADVLKARVDATALDARIAMLPVLKRRNRLPRP